LQLINQLDSPSIAGQSGFADMLVQLGVANRSLSSSADASEDGGDAAAAAVTATNSTRGSKGKKGARTNTVSPAMDAVFLNGLQCTRLPLAKLPAGAGGLPEDCGAAAWALDADSRGVFAMPAGLNLGNLTESSNASFFALLWGVLSNTSSNSSSSSSSGGGGNATTSSARLPHASVEAALQVLRQASCMSRLCCGLQVVDMATAEAINGSRALAANDTSTPPPMVGAFDGPDASTKVRAAVGHCLFAGQGRLTIAAVPFLHRCR
jgi:hypothetical protein